jgi:hypothetical protein
MRSRSGGNTVRVVGAILAGLLLPMSTLLATAGSATVLVTSHFIVTAPSDSSLFVTPINNGATNGAGSALLFVTPNDSPGGVCGCVTDTVPVGVVYNLFGGAEWAITNLDESTTIAPGTSFNVLVVPKPSASVFVQTATTANTSAAVTYIDSPLTNGKPNAHLLVTPNLNPPGMTGFVSNHRVGVAYSASRKQWGVLNEDAAAMPIGAHFNVMVGTTMSNGGKEIVQRNTSQNAAGEFTLISNPETTGNPNAAVFETPNYNPGGLGGTPDNVSTGVAYLLDPTDRETVFQEDGSSMPLGAAFNVLIYPS